MSDDDFESVVASMTDEGAAAIEQGTPEPEVTESVAQDRNPDGTYKASESNDEPESDDTTEEVAADAGESDKSGELETQPERPERNRNVSERIGQLTAQRNEARARAEMLESQLLQYQPVQIDPNLEYEDPAGFTKATIREALTEQNVQAAAAQAEQARQAQLQTSQQMFFERVDAVKSEMPDFDQVFEQAWVSPVGVEFLAESEVGPRVAYHLGKNPNLSHRIANMQPVQQGIELARLEAQLAKPPAKRTTKAPAPAKTIGGAGSSGTFDPQSASVDDVAKALGY